MPLICFDGIACWSLRWRWEEKLISGDECRYVSMVIESMLSNGLTALPSFSLTQQD
jgi:hypothetical protein